MNTNTRLLSIVLISILLLTGNISTFTQEGDDSNTESACWPALENFYTTASTACLGKPDGHICNGGTPPYAEPGGPIANSLATVGALVQTDLVDALATYVFAEDGNNGGLLWMRVEGTQAAILMIGEAATRDLTPPDSGFPEWQSLLVRTGESIPICESLPRGSFVVQNSVPYTSTRIAINGASLELLGTVMVQTQGEETIFMALSGQVRIVAVGQSQQLVAGQQTTITHAQGDFTQASSAPSSPAPFDAKRISNFPVQLLDRAARLPEPGFVSTTATVNLRAASSVSAGIIREVAPDTLMTILGRNNVGDWYHVRLPSGVTGWMYAELLRRNHGAITSVYESTPVPPQRFGDLGTKAWVIAPAGVNLRSDPHVGFDAIFTLQPGEEIDLIARSPYSPWVKVDANGVIGWAALITLDTQVIIESLPVDYQVPPPPEPTTIPGLASGAHPDPSCYPNCD